MSNSEVDILEGSELYDYVASLLMKIDKLEGRPKTRTVMGNHGTMSAQSVGECRPCATTQLQEPSLPDVGGTTLEWTPK